MVVKIQKINFWYILKLLLGSLTLRMGCKIYFCDNFSWEGFLYLIPFSSRIVWIDKLNDLLKRFFPNKGFHGNRKNIFPVIIARVAEKEKCFIKNINLIDTYYHWKNWVDWISARPDKMLQPQKYTFWEKLKS